MTEQKMTIHRGLSELKLIDSRIEKQIREIDPVGGIKKNSTVNGLYTLDAFKKAATSKLASIEDLIDRKVRIKSAIVKANSETKVKIGSVDYTIADAINYRASVNLKKSLILSLKEKYTKVTSSISKNNDVVDANGLRLAETALQKDNVKVGDNDVDMIMKPYIEANKIELVDPLKVNDLIQRLEKEVEDFETEIDSCLSEINSVTYIII